MKDAKTPEGFSLRRWSRRKLESAHPAAAVEPQGPVPAASPVAAPAAAAAPAPPPEPAPALPPVESLTPDADFTAFMQPKVDEALRRQALRKLFSDPHFNVMDGLDVYIDDYTKPDPIPPSVVERLMQMGFVRDAGASVAEPARPHEAPREQANAPVASTAIEAAPAAVPTFPPAEGTVDVSAGTPPADDASER